MRPSSDAVGSTPWIDVHRALRDPAPDEDARSATVHDQWRMLAAIAEAREALVVLAVPPAPPSVTVSTWAFVFDDSGSRHRPEIAFPWGAEGVAVLHDVVSEVPTRLGPAERRSVSQLLTVPSGRPAGARPFGVSWFSYRWASRPGLALHGEGLWLHDPASPTIVDTLAADLH